MSTIQIRQKNYMYHPQDVIEFAEGLIGLPEMRRAVLIEMDEFEPFMWLASLENEKDRFIVVDPFKVYDGYKPFVGDASSAKRDTLAIVKISSDWKQTTINLRAPIIIDAATRSGEQLILTESAYQLAERLPQE